MLLQLLVVVLVVSSSCEAFEFSTTRFTSKSGLPVARYGLGGAARSTQPSTLPSLYVQELKENIAPFFFYYNPHRYPDFMKGIKDVCRINRQDIFVAGGGTSRSIASLDQRLADCLEYCDNEYLDLFILEYVLPDEMETAEENDYSKAKVGTELLNAIKNCRQWVKDGKVRYIGISTHSHVVGSILANVPEIDALMLRYGMSHKEAAEKLSLPAARENDKPVICFTSTRWNSLQDGLGNGQDEFGSDDTPTSSDCLSFVFGSRHSPPIEFVLHSARDENELLECLSGMKLGFSSSSDEEKKWREYGKIFEDRNEDGFDEYPEERQL